MPYNGHRNWNYWNVSLWINNDELLYHTALHYVRYNRTKTEAAKGMLAHLNEAGMTKTPDGVKFTVYSIRAAMVGM